MQLLYVTLSYMFSSGTYPGYPGSPYVADNNPFVEGGQSFYLVSGVYEPAVIADPIDDYIDDPTAWTQGQYIENSLGSGYWTQKITAMSFTKPADFASEPEVPDGKGGLGWKYGLAMVGDDFVIPVLTPVVTGISQTTTTHNKIIQAASLFSVSDPAGRAITQYSFWDNGNGGGHFLLNGVAQAAGKVFTVQASQLSQVQYEVGSGADTLQVQVFDGVLSSNWSSNFTVTGPTDPGPVVTPVNSTITTFQDQTFSAGSLVTYSDAFGNAATKYDVWNSGGGGGHFMLNGASLGINQNNVITAAQFSQVTYQAGTGSDTLWIEAFDGTAWGPWSNPITINATNPVISSTSSQGIDGASGSSSNFVQFTVTLSQAQSTAVSVQYATQDDTAKAGINYTATAGTLTFAPGTTSLVINVPTIGTDNKVGNTDFDLVLSNPTNAKLPNGVTSQPYTGTITDINTLGTIPSPLPGWTQNNDQSAGNYLESESPEYEETISGGYEDLQDDVVAPTLTGLLQVAAKQVQTTFYNYLEQKATDLGVSTAFQMAKTLWAEANSVKVKSLTNIFTTFINNEFNNMDKAVFSDPDDPDAARTFYTETNGATQQMVDQADQYAQSNLHAVNNSLLNPLLTDASYQLEMDGVTNSSGSSQPKGVEFNVIYTGITDSTPVFAATGLYSVFVGGADNETVHGSNAGNTFAAGGGNDTFYGGSGTDTFIGGSGAGTFVAGSGNADFVGGSGSQNITITGSGQDAINPGSGAVTLSISGTGNNTYDVGSSMTGPSGIVADNGSFTYDFQSSGSSTFGATLSGSGTFNVKGAGGILTMSGSDTFTGTTKVDGATLNNATILNTATLDVDAGGTVSGTQLQSGGIEDVFAGGVDSNGSIFGSQYDYGVTRGTTVSGSGRVVVESGGAANGVIVQSGGTIVVESGASAVGTIVSTGGTLAILSGGNASGTINNGGTVVNASLPVLTVASLAAAARGQAINLASLVTISDPSHIGYQALQLWDSNGTPAGGEFLINGVAQTAGHAINVPTGATVVFDAGTSFGTDTLWAQLIQDNGVASGWQKFSVSMSLPALRVNSVSNATRGQAINLSSLVTVADPSNTGYQTLQLWDSAGTAAGGEFLINGSVQTAGHAINVPAGAAVVFDAGTSTGTDTLWAQLIQSNGTASGWQQFTVTVAVPTVNVTSIANATRGQAINLSSLVTVSDPNHIGYQTLQLWDSAGTAAGGEFFINGAVQTAGHAINVPTGASVIFDAGTSAGTDTIWAQLIQSNGTASGWQQFAVSVPQPSISVASNLSAAAGQALALSNLVTILDPGGVGYANLQLWDSAGTPAGGEFLINGSVQPANATISVSQANVAHAVFDVGTSGTDVLYAQLVQNDGTLGGWKQFAVTAVQGVAPSLVVSSVSGATRGQTLSLSSLVTILDPSGVGYQKLELWDSNGTVTGGQFVVGGVAKAGNVEIDVNSSTFANTVYDVGTLGGTDTLKAALVLNNGTTTAQQQFTVSAPPGVAPVLVQAGATVNIGASFTGQIEFLGSTGTVVLQNPSSFQGSIVGMSGDDTIDLSGYVYQTTSKQGTGGSHIITLVPSVTTTYSGTTSGGTLTIADTIGSLTMTVALVGDYSTAAFWASSDGNGGTDIVDPPLAGPVSATDDSSESAPVSIGDGATVELTQAYAGAAIFTGNTGTLQIDHSAAFSGTVSGLGGQNQLDLQDIGYGATRSLVFAANRSNTGGTLSVSDGTHLAQITLLGQYAASSFVTAADGHGGTTVELQPALAAVLTTSQHA